MEVWAVLTPILVADMVNPVLLAALIYALGSDRPLLLSSSLLAGHTVMYLTAGLVFAIGLESILDRLASPEPIDFVIEAVIGVALLAVAAAMVFGGKKAASRYEEEDVQGFGPGQAFGVGLFINLIGIPFALPYFGAVSQISKADLSATAGIGMIGLYNLLYALPFALVIAARGIFGKRAEGPLQRLNAGMERVSAVLVPVLLLGVGLLLVSDALWYWTNGESLPLLQAASQPASLTSDGIGPGS